MVRPSQWQTRPHRLSLRRRLYGRAGDGVRLVSEALDGAERVHSRRSSRPNTTSRWHRDNCSTSARLADVPALAAHVRTACPLLTLSALPAVEPLGFEEVAPDATGWEEVPEPTGHLWQALYDDHPIHADYDTLRVHTRGAGVTIPYARYESIAPRSCSCSVTTSSMRTSPM